MPIKRKSYTEAPIDERKRVHKMKRKKPEEWSWGYSTKLMLYDDPWKIKKELTHSDLGLLCRLLMPKELSENLVLPVLSLESQREAMSENGTKITIWDVDTQSMHHLVFKFLVSSKSYVFKETWIKDFVKRRSLKKGDEIGFHWNPYKNWFNFSVLVHA